jgi:formamidopyrimidine-DNA glycosylase
LGGRVYVPELPEVEILRDELRSHVLGRRVKKLVIPEGRQGSCPLPQWKAALEGGMIVEVERRGKMLLVHLDSGFSLVVHLMMVGQLLLSSLHHGEPQDVCLVLDFGEDRLSLGQVHLKFVRLVCTRELEELPELQKLGCDPLEGEFTAPRLGELLVGRKGKIKSFLLDQRYVAGIGNTYADEILFEAGISPIRVACSLTGEEVQTLHLTIVRTLRRGLELGGSSEMAFVHLDGSKGSFQEQFRVKGRKGEPCLVCGTTIERVSVGGRGTYFCPACQV